VKSVVGKLRNRTGLIDDGNVLFDHVFGGDIPMLVNGFQTMSEKSEQKGFVNLLKGPTAPLRILPFMRLGKIGR
jgi:uncharacterized protein (TIGR02391 family)